MPEYTPLKGKYAGQKRFRITEQSEREILEDARTHHGGARPLLTDGLGYQITGRSHSQRFNYIKNGEIRRKQRKTPYTISLQDWEKIKHYAELSRKGILSNPRI